MVSKILDFSKKNHSLDEINAFQNEILIKNNARNIFLFAKYVKNANIEILSNAIINTNDKRYIHFFVRTIKNIDYEMFINKIIEFQDPKLLFYIAYDTFDLPEKYIIIIAQELSKLNDFGYFVSLLYYYFITLNLNNEKMFYLLKQLLIKKDIKVDDIYNNYIDILEKLRMDLSKKYDISNISGLSDNCYKDRKNIVPHIIVCHITSSYEEGIKIFYDKKTSVSSHYIVARDGRSKQIIDLKYAAWASGTSINEESDVYYKFATNPLISTRNENANYYTFSIEHESLDGDLTDLQYNETLSIMKKIIIFLKEEYNHDFVIDRNHIIGHNEVNPIVRTVCPGKKFPFDRLINDLLEWKK